MRKRRSWLMITRAERRLFSSLSSHSIAGRSRWLVGSSRSRMSGSGASTRASAARRASPPESDTGFSSPVRPRSLRSIAARYGIVERIEAGLDIVARRGEAGEVWLLRQVADRRAGLEEPRPRIRLDLPRGDLEQRRLARAVAPDEAQPLALRHREVGASQQRVSAAAEGEVDVLQGEKRRGSHGGCLAGRPAAVIPLVQGLVRARTRHHEATEAEFRYRTTLR